MKYFKLVLLLFFIQSQAQQGGMWVPSLLNSMNEAEMKSLGSKISIKDIYDANKSSLKDAVPQFNGGCTSEVISPKGLILTNHHCGFDAIQNHSTVEHDYLRDGFWAYKMEEEIPNKDLEVTFIIKIEEVTTQVLKGVSTITSELEKQKKIQQNIAELTKNLPHEEKYSLSDQIRRSSRSVCTNFVEACKRKRYKDYFISKLNDAETENAETQVWLDFSFACKYITSEKQHDLTI